MSLSPDTVRVAFIGAGQRGLAYAHALHSLKSKGSSNAVISSIVEPIPEKRNRLGSMYMWGPEGRTARPWEQFDNWQAWIDHEVKLRSATRRNGHVDPSGETHSMRETQMADAVIICVLDEMHVVLLRALAEAGLIGERARERGWQELHVLCEKPLATTLEDVMEIYRFVAGGRGEEQPRAIFGVCHVLRYSPHNMLLRDLTLDKRVVGDILSLEHTEPVGWWHFSHSYVRGNWRNSSKTAPSLLTKSCHDIDFILWLLCWPPTSTPASQLAHVPSSVSSMGSINLFRKSQKPRAAGNATNCMSCRHEQDCMYSALKIYRDRLRDGITDWPVNIVVPDIEDIFKNQGKDVAEKTLIDALSEDYTSDTPLGDRLKRPWMGRCVWECDNDVCDDQTVMMQWEDDPLQTANGLEGRPSKTATFHMIAQTERQCERRGRIYGTKGEIEYDSKKISVHDFASGKTDVHYPPQPGGGHGGGDEGLARQFVGAVNAVKNEKMDVADAQARFLGCTLEDVVRSHAMVWAAEEARRERKVIDWKSWDVALH